MSNKEKMSKLQELYESNGNHFHEVINGELYWMIIYNKSRTHVFSPFKELHWREREKVIDDINREVGGGRYKSFGRSGIIWDEWFGEEKEPFKGRLYIKWYIWDEVHNEKHPEHICMKKIVEDDKSLREYYGLEPSEPKMVM